MSYYDIIEFIVSERNGWLKINGFLPNASAWHFMKTKEHLSYVFNWEPLRSTWIRPQGPEGPPPLTSGYHARPWGFKKHPKQVFSLFWKCTP